MADVFISYKSQDRATTERVAELLRLNELSVWWDDKLQGEVADDVITAQIANSYAVVVLISKRALGSNWVQGEIVRARDKVVPVRVDDFPHDDLPTPLLRNDIIDLSNWNRQADDAEFPKLLARCIELKTGKKPVIISAPRRDVVDPPIRNQSIEKSTVINIGHISGGKIEGGIGNTHQNIMVKYVSNAERRETD